VYVTDTLLWIVITIDRHWYDTRLCVNLLWLAHLYAFRT